MGEAKNKASQGIVVRPLACPSAAARPWLQTKYNDPAVDKVTALRSELENVRDAAMMNIDRVLERGERLEGMAEKTSLLR